MTRLRDDIYAVEGGTVLYVLKTPSDYGWRIYIKHKDGSTAMYAHLSAFNCKVGDTIEAGDKIATMGNTGTGTGTHLHISYFSEFAKDLTGKSASDPTYWIMLGSWPTNTTVSGGYHNVYAINGKEYLHEGIDFSYSRLIIGWEEGNINGLIQDMRLQE